MDEIGVYEARTRFGELLTDVEKGRRVVITRHGKPVAILSPVRGANPIKVRKTIEKLLEGRQGRLLNGDISAFIEEGRKN